MYKFLNFNPDVQSNPPLDTNKDVPCQIEIYSKSLEEFFPNGKTWDEMTEEEKTKAKNQYRFQSFRPGRYQMLTGFRGMI